MLRHPSLHVERLVCDPERPLGPVRLLRHGFTLVAGDQHPSVNEAPRRESCVVLVIANHANRPVRRSEREEQLQGSRVQTDFKAHPLLDDVWSSLRWRARDAWSHVPPPLGPLACGAPFHAAYLGLSAFVQMPTLAVCAIQFSCTYSL